MESNTLPSSQILKDSACRAGFVYELIFACNRSVHLIWKRISALGLANPPNVAMLARIDNWHKLTRMQSEFQKQILLERFFMAAQDALSNFPDNLVAIVDQDAVVVLSSIEQQYERSFIKHESIQFAEELLASLRERIEESITIGIGSSYDDPRNLRLSYREALQAEQYKFFLGKGRTIHFEDVSRSNWPSLQERFLLKGLELSSEIGQGNNSCAPEGLSELFSWLQQIGAEPELVKLYMMKVLIELGGSAVQACGAREDIQKAQVAAARKLVEADTIEEIEKWVKGVAVELGEIVHQRLSGRNRRAVRAVLDYIHKNYKSDISLSEVADYVHLSPSHLSRVFRDETGSSFVEYIKKLRVTKAKEMLGESKLSVQEVSEAVGYKDPRYFSKVFKSLVGLSPCAYRMYG